MYRILQITTIKNILTIEIDGLILKNKIGDVVRDNNNNLFKITSVAMISGPNVNKNNTTLVVEPLNEVIKYGTVLYVD